RRGSPTQSVEINVGGPRPGQRRPVDPNSFASPNSIQHSLAFSFVLCFLRFPLENPIVAPRRICLGCANDRVRESWREKELMTSDYWDTWWRLRSNRRRFLQAGAATGVGAAGLAL